MRHWLSNAHPFFWTVAVVAIIGVLAGVFVEGRAPGYALNSEWIYRLQIIAATFIVLYVLLLVVWLAYQGRTVQRADLPGGAGVELPDLDKAAEGFAEYKKATDERIQRLEDSFDILDQADDRTLRSGVTSMQDDGEAADSDREERR